MLVASPPRFGARCAIPSFQSDPVEELVAGLAGARKHLPARLGLDAYGVELRERLARTRTYYPAEAERTLLDRHAAHVAHQVGPEPRVVVVANGAPDATLAMLRAIERPTSVVAIGSSTAQVEALVRAIRIEHSALEIQPVVADLIHDFDLPVPQREWRRTFVFVPGGSIDALAPSDARAVLARLARLAGDDRLLVVGSDATRDPDTAIRAYADDSGICEALDRNVLAVLNRTRGATFDIDAFEHRVIWNARAAVVERQLVSERHQIVVAAGRSFTITAGEAIAIEQAHKHAPEAMRALLAAAGWRTRQVFTWTHEPYRLWLTEPHG